MAEFDKLPEFTQWAFITAISNDERLVSSLVGEDINVSLVVNGIELDIEHVFERMYENMLSKVDERAKELSVENSPSVSTVMNKLYHIQEQLNLAVGYVDSAIQETYN